MFLSAFRLHGSSFAPVPTEAGAFHNAPRTTLGPNAPAATMEGTRLCEPKSVVDRMLWRLICPGFGLGVALQGIGYGPADENPN
jgi:hypothetical protein